MSERRYPFFVYPIDTDTGTEWAVEFYDVPGVIGGGETELEAIEDAFDNLEAHLQFLKEDGEILPVASDFDENYSGKLPFRTSKSTHRRLKMAADREGVSINQYINEAVVEKLTKSEYSTYLSEIISEISIPTKRFFMRNYGGDYSKESHVDSATTVFSASGTRGYTYGAN